MRHKHQISLIVDFTGETINTIFATLKSQFSNFILEFIQKVIENLNKLFNRYNWLIINVTRNQ